MNKNSINKYEVYYSKYENAIVLVSSYLVSAMIMALILFVIAAVYGMGIIHDNYHVISLMFLGLAVIMLPFSLVNYLKQNKMCARYAYIVGECAIDVVDNVEKIRVEFKWQEILSYQVVNIGYSSYEAIKIFLCADRYVIIYNSMKNYKKVKKDLHLRKIDEDVSADTRIGSYEGNSL